MKTAKYWDDHWNSVSFWMKHGGPHILWLAGVFIALYQFGIIDKPAWSADVQSLEKQVSKVQQDVGAVQTSVSDVKKAIQGIKIESARRDEQAKSTTERLKGIDSKLNILINRGLNYGNGQ